MKILYIHGYGGRANGSSSQMIAKYCPNDDVFAPGISYKEPKTAVEEINNYVEKYSPDVIVASSLGGYYTLQVDCGVPRVLINPALPTNMKKIDSDNKFLEELNTQLVNIKDTSEDTVNIVCGTSDTVAPNLSYFAKRYGNKLGYRVDEYDMGHDLTEDCVKNYLTEVFRNIRYYSLVFGNERETKIYESIKRKSS